MDILPLVFRILLRTVKPSGEKANSYKWNSLDYVTRILPETTPQLGRAPNASPIRKFDGIRCAGCHLRERDKPRQSSRLHAFVRRQHFCGIRTDRSAETKR